jgi:hypothetical protein
MSMPAASIWAIRPRRYRTSQPLGAAAELARLFLEVAPRTIEKARRGEMLFKRDGAQALMLRCRWIPLSRDFPKDADA